MKYLITFPERLKNEIIESLKKAKEEVKDLDKSKRAKAIRLVYKAVGVDIGTVVYSDYKILNSNTILWTYDVVGENIFPKEALRKLVEKRLNESFNTNEIRVEIYEKKKKRRK